MFFLFVFVVLSITYSWVGWRLVAPLQSDSGWRWVIIGLLVFHFISVFVSFAILRNLGPGGWAAPLYWVAYGGMGLFSLVFTGMVVAETGLLTVRVKDSFTDTKSIPEDEDLPTQYDDYDDESYIDGLQTDGFNSVYDPLDELFGEPIAGYSLY